MTANNLQKQIIQKTTLIDSAFATTDALIESYISNLEILLEKDLTREPSSNIYLLAKNFVESSLEARFSFIDIVNEILNVFDSNRFAYIASSYTGVEQGLLALGIFNSVSILYKEYSFVQIILYPKEETDLLEPDMKLLIAATLHKLLPLGNTYSTDPNNLITQAYNASTGRAITYNFYNVNIRQFILVVSYTLDYEEKVEDFNHEQKIIDEVNIIYSELYNAIGKDFKVKDFYSLTRNVQGLSDVNITVKEAGQTDVVDEDIIIGETEVFTIEAVEVIDLNAVSIKQALQAKKIVAEHEEKQTVSKVEAVIKDPVSKMSSFLKRFK